MNYGNKFDVQGRLALDTDALYHLYEQLSPPPHSPTGVHSLCPYRSSSRGHMSTSTPLMHSRSLSFMISSILQFNFDLTYLLMA